MNILELRASSQELNSPWGKAIRNETLENWFKVCTVLETLGMLPGTHLVKLLCAFANPVQPPDRMSPKFHQTSVGTAVECVLFAYFKLMRPPAQYTFSVINENIKFIELEYFSPLKFLIEIFHLIQSCLEIQSKYKMKKNIFLEFVKL